MIGGQGVARAHRVTGTLGLEAVWVSVIVGSGSWCVYPVVNKLLLPPRDAERRRRLLVALLGVSQNCRDVVHVWSCKQSESKSKISVSGENLTTRQFTIEPLTTGLGFPVPASSDHSYEVKLVFHGWKTSTHHSNHKAPFVCVCWCFPE